MRKIAVGLTLLCLPIFAACSSKAQVVMRTEYIHPQLPMHLLEPTPCPDVPVEVNEDLVVRCKAFEDAYKESESDKAAMKTAIEGAYK